MTKKYKVYFNVKGLEGSIYENIPGLKDAMGSELIRVYNMFADKNNAGITDKLNEEFKKLNDSADYNRFMANGYQRLVVDELNRTKVSPLLNFYVDPEEVVFTGYLKHDRNVTIDFYLREA